MSEQASGGVKWPAYQCHKTVYALKIKEVAVNGVGVVIAVPEDPAFQPLPLPADFVKKHQPQAGGYLVMYQDGYRSYSPAKAFEEGYTKI